MGQGLGSRLVCLSVLVEVGGPVISSYPNAEFSWVSAGASGVMWIQVWLCPQACVHTCVPAASHPPTPHPPTAGRRGDGDLITASAKAP